MVSVADRPGSIYPAKRMFGPISQRILSLLQLTRMALVFTAIADGAAEVVLRHQLGVDPAGAAWPLPPHVWYQLGAMAVTSIGLYGFGMTLNDIIDRRRDSGVAAHRPLPSGRVRLLTAYGVCTALAIIALLGGAAYARLTPDTGWSLSFPLVLLTGLLITFYDVGGKYFLTTGLISLGAIRFLNAAVAAPWLPIVWHPLLLLNHVAILSRVAYGWEEKRPVLQQKQRWGFVAALVGMDVLAIAFIAWRRGGGNPAELLPSLDVRPGLLIPLAAVALFVGVGGFVRWRYPVARDAGQKLMLFGLLWLIVYDAAFVVGYASWQAGVVLLMLLPVAWWSVQFMRWWSKVLSLSHRPAFQRARG